ncbi:hypothetical protein RchiOBHm_Chr4g0426091 [Rosa chinensis]|uniref:Uncharacterized protein n=1 Tax=Rosa chinensis TaxID=74649 RepID=A0A2P6QZ99_ROSCH|nr:hypothetical protein RchiOBHm_Chr4g0426091 [Rosa chinensis]
MPEPPPLPPSHLHSSTASLRQSQCDSFKASIPDPSGKGLLSC